jgi:hypothetical protein
VLIGSPAHILIVMLAFAIGSTYRGILARLTKPKEALP